MFEQSKDPDFINDEGVRWWLDKGLTDYAQKEDQFGTKLDGFTSWIIETKDGQNTRILLDGENYALESPRMEDIACRIDIIKASKRF